MVSTSVDGGEAVATKVGRALFVAVLRVAAAGGCVVVAPGEASTKASEAKQPSSNYSLLLYHRAPPDEPRPLSFCDPYQIRIKFGANSEQMLAHKKNDMSICWFYDKKN